MVASRRPLTALQQRQLDSATEIGERLLPLVSIDVDQPADETYEWRHHHKTAYDHRPAPGITSFSLEAAAAHQP